ncbi:MAG: phosphomannomutase/phosphoglucomutase [Candidatus Peribacteraceae bacterium]|nr:phosphomannomutase/phosphoglucomutase [Candidatus Peribacteraceae bacterium]
MSSIDPHIFRAYDIRGKANEQVTEEACTAIGRAFGTELRERYGIDAPTVAAGRDARTHSPALEAAVVQGLKQAGCTVLRIGQVPSPVSYFTICDRHLDGSIQVTASHNGPQDNGLKLQIRHAEAFAGEDLQQLRRQIEKGHFLAGQGTEEEIDAITPYLERLSALFPEIGAGVHVVIDTGNGVAGPAYCEALRRAGCTVTELYTEPDGTFPNHPADPSKQETLRELQETVRRSRAHFGMAFDGDGDRLGIVDEQGAIRTADEVLLLLARDHLSRHPGAPVIFTVSNSGILDSEIRKWGGNPVMCKVGHSFVEHAMREHRALLGGEQSGHFFCGEGYYEYDDALVAGLRVLKIAADSGQPFSALFREFPKVFQAPERRPHCPDDKKGAVIQQATAYFLQAGYPVNTLDGARIDFGEGAWAGIRQSNTSPRLSICMEARTAQRLHEVEEAVLGHMRSYPEITW